MILIVKFDGDLKIIPDSSEPQPMVFWCEPYMPSLTDFENSDGGIRTVRKFAAERIARANGVWLYKQVI